ISLLLALFVLVFGELSGILLPMNDSSQTAQAATAVNVTASTEAQLDSYLSSTTTSYNIQITANITLTAGITVGNSQTLYGNGSAVLDTASYAIATPAGASLTLGDNNSSDSLTIQNESGYLLTGAGNLTINDATNILSSSTTNEVIYFTGGNFIGNGGNITRTALGVATLPYLVHLAGGSFSLYGGTYKDNSGGASLTHPIFLLESENVPIISGGTISGDGNNAIETYNTTITSITGGDFSANASGLNLNNSSTVALISGGTFGSLNGSEASPQSMYGIVIGATTSVTKITNGTFTGGNNAVINASGLSNSLGEIEGGSFYGGSVALNNTVSTEQTLLEPSLVTPTQGTARFRGGASGNSILNNAANFTLPTGYSISSTSTTSGVTPTSLGSLGFYYLTPSSEAVTFNWQLSSSAKAIQGSALFTNQSTSNTFTATGNYSYGSSLSTLANFGATGDTPNTYLTVPFNTGSPTYGTQGYYIQSITNGTNTVSATYSSGTTAATATPSTTVPASIPASWTVGSTTTANTYTVTVAPYLQTQNWTEVFTNIGGGTSPVLATNPFYVSQGLTGANVTYPTLPTIPTGYYIHDIQWTNHVNQYNTNGTPAYSSINGTAGATYSSSDATSLIKNLYDWDYYGQYVGSSNTTAPAVYTPNTNDIKVNLAAYQSATFHYQWKNGSGTGTLPSNTSVTDGTNGALLGYSASAQKDEFPTDSYISGYNQVVGLTTTNSVTSVTTTTYYGSLSAALAANPTYANNINSYAFTISYYPQALPFTGSKGSSPWILAVGGLLLIGLFIAYAPLPSNQSRHDKKGRHLSHQSHLK
ncbi:MAG: beta strand repeat-containing protein, partial [Lactococcus sp.]